MELFTIQSQIEGLILYFEDNNQELAELKANYEQKDEFKKTQLALCEMCAEGKTQAEISRNALASKEFRSFLEELAQIRLNYYKKKAEYEAKSAQFEGYRSLNKNLT